MSPDAQRTTCAISAPMRVALASRLDRHRAAERLPVPHRDHDAGHEAELAEIAEALGLALVDAPDLDRLADGDVGERRAHELMDEAVGVGNRVAMWIDGRMPQRDRHPLDQRVRHGMLQPLGLRVDGIPAVAEELDQVRLDEPVAADHPERGAAAGIGELDALVGSVLEQAELGQSLDHAAHGGRAQLEQVRDIAGRGGAAFRAKPVDRLEVVLDGAGKRFLMGGYVHAKL